jgi:uncharacterized protein YbjQ (UPF0145 family)
MKLTFRAIGFLSVAALVMATPARARDEILHMPVKEAMEAAVASGKLDKGVKLFFGKQKHAKAAGEYGTFTANKKANFFGKSDKQACERAFLSAIISVQERARKERGNAVIGIISVYKNIEFSSETEYECGAGNVTGGVALRGKMAKL